MRTRYLVQRRSRVAHAPNADGCYDGGITFWLKYFVNDGSPQPKIVGISYNVLLLLYFRLVYILLDYSLRIVQFLFIDPPAAIGVALFCFLVF